MADIRIEQLRVPETLGGPDAADFLLAVEVSRQVRINTWGNDDLAYTGEEMLAICRDHYEWYVVLVARLNGDIVGRAGIAMPLDDDTDTAHVTLDVLPAAQGHGLGRALLEAAETFVRGENRRIVIVETNHAPADLEGAGSEMIQAATGPGGLPLSSREARFAFSAGYLLEQVSRFSSRTLPVPGDEAQALIDEAEAAHAGAYAGAYAMHAWKDHCPQEWAEDFIRLGRLADPADLAGRMWDEGLLRESEDLSLAAGRHTLVSAAECLATGRLVGFTAISVLGHRNDVVFQDDTVVEEEHRGREIGMRLRLANLAQLESEFPEARTVYTWDAPANSNMLAANARLGFALSGVTGQWQKDFDAAP